MHRNDLLTCTCSHVSKRRRLVPPPSPFSPCDGPIQMFRSSDILTHEHSDPVTFRKIKLLPKHGPLLLLVLPGGRGESTLLHDPLVGVGCPDKTEGLHIGV